jgi:hypothetical protein
MRKRYHALILLVVFSSGCLRWQPVPMSPLEYAEQGHQERVRVVKRDGSRAVIESPRFGQDSIRVIAGTCTPVGDRMNKRYMCPTEAVAAMSDVESVEVQSFNRWTTGLVVAPVVAIVGLVLVFEGLWDGWTF